MARCVAIVRRRKRRAKEANPACLRQIWSLLKNDFRCRAGHLRKAGGVPVAEVNAAIALRAPNPGRLGRAVDAIMRLVEVDPNNADGIVGAGLQHGFPVTFGSIPEQGWIIMIGRQERYALYGPLSDRQRIMLAPCRRGKLCGETVLTIIDLE
jgi:hypothetical protein